MPDWTRSMNITYDIYKVDPDSWNDIEKITTVKSCTITNDGDVDTLGSATFSLGEVLEECYVRVYLVTTQDGLKERFALGTRLLMTPNTKYNGKSFTIDMDGYTPLIELKEKLPPLGYSIMEGQNIIDMAYSLIRENTRGRVVKMTIPDPEYEQLTLIENFIANTNDTWLSYIKDLLALTKYHLELDEMGKILFAPAVNVNALQPRYVFNDDNSSILYPDIESEDDLYGIPNVIEVSCSTIDGCSLVRIVNNDISSPTSIINRGREIHYRETSPGLMGNPSEREMVEYAERLMEQISTVKRTITFEHGYCPIRVGDAVELNYRRAEIYNLKAVIVRQNIVCDKACKIQETAVYTKKLWDHSMDRRVFSDERFDGREVTVTEDEIVSDDEIWDDEEEIIVG